MQTSELSEVKRLLTYLHDLENRAKLVQGGHVDATIHGVYFGDYLSDEEFEVLRALAIRFIAVAFCDVVASLESLEIGVEDANGHQLRGVNHCVSFLEGLEKPKRRNR